MHPELIFIIKIASFRGVKRGKGRNAPGAKSLEGRRKIPMSQILSLIEYICSPKELSFEQG